MALGPSPQGAAALMHMARCIYSSLSSVFCNSVIGGGSDREFLFVGCWRRSVESVLSDPRTSTIVPVILYVVTLPAHSHRAGEGAGRREHGICLIWCTVDVLSHRIMLRQYAAAHPHAARNLVHHLVTKVLQPPK